MTAWSPDRSDTAQPADFGEIGGQALRGLAARVGVAYLVGPAVVSALMPPRFPGAQLVVVAVIVAAVGAILAAARPQAGRREWLAALLLVTLTAVAVQACLVDEGRGIVPLTAPWVVSSGTAAVTLAISPRVGAAVLVWLGAVSFLAGKLAGEPVGLVDLAGPVTTFAVTAVVAVMVRRGFRITEAAVQGSEAVQVAQQVAHAQWVARRRADRVLHDTVLSTLSVLAHGGRGVYPERLREACRTDVELLRRGLVAPPNDEQEPPNDGEARVGDALEGLRQRYAQQGLAVRLHRTGAPAAGEAAAVAALAPAVNECLGNVLRHAGVSAADVVVDSTPEELHVIVVDEGVGFDPSTIPPDRLGLSQSVAARLAELGGSATVWSTPGQGTSVHLRMPRTPGSAEAAR